MSAPYINNVDIVDKEAFKVLKGQLLKTLKQNKKIYTPENPVYKILGLELETYDEQKLVGTDEKFIRKIMKKNLVTDDIKTCLKYSDTLEEFIFRLIRVQKIRRDEEIRKILLQSHLSELAKKLLASLREEREDDV